MPKASKYHNSCGTGVAAYLSRSKGLVKTVLGVVFLAWLLNPASATAALVSPALYDVVVGWLTSADPQVTGYHIWYGTAPGNYSNNILLGNVTSVTITGLAAGVTYYFVVTAYNATGAESAASSEVSFVPGIPFAQFNGLAGGSATLTLTGLIGHTYEIQATEDLSTWYVIGTATLGADGTARFTDTNANKYTKQFYRTHDTSL